MRRADRMRRAKNIVWAAAGAYHFTPAFLAFYRDGTPDIYFNSIVGLVHRHYDAAILAEFFRSIDDSLLRDTFSDVVWMGLEHAVYLREIPRRPALEGLRAEHARRFLADQADVSMQELMARDDLVHTLQAARCRECLTGAHGLRNPWERSLYAALAWDGNMGTEELVARARDVLRRYFVFRFRDVLRRRAWHIPLGGRVHALLRRILPMERHFHDALLPVTSSEAGQGGAPFGGLRGLVTGQRPWSAALAADVADAFGAPLISEQARAAIEHEICQGAHREAHIAFTRGCAHEGAQEANRAYLAAHARVCQTGIRQLAARLKNTLAVMRAPLRLAARSGAFAPALVWRAVNLGDRRVFYTSEEIVSADLSVTLLLDASASREAQQGAVAMQAYLVAEALSRVQISVQVVSFSSVWGVTVLSELKPFAGGKSEAALRYAARGWNRDGLALRAVRPLLRGAGKQILIVLTDAHPADVLPLADGALTHDYAGERAVRDAAEAVKDLKKDDVHVVGVMNSVLPETQTDGAARAIFGSSFTRIERPEQLAARVGALVEEQICGGSAR